MENYIMPSKLRKITNRYKEQKAAAQKTGDQLSAAFQSVMKKESVLKLCEIIIENGHPNEVNVMKSIQSKYLNGDPLEGDQIVALVDLAESNRVYFSSKGNGHNE